MSEELGRVEMGIILIVIGILAGGGIVFILINIGEEMSIEKQASVCADNIESLVIYQNGTFIHGFGAELVSDDSITIGAIKQKYLLYPVLGRLALEEQIKASCLRQK